MVRTFGGYLLGATALVACPCHLPITLPLLLVVLGGTALGPWLTGNLPLVLAGAGLYFLAGLAGAVWLLSRPSAGVARPTTGDARSDADAPGCCAPVGRPTVAAIGEREEVTRRG